MSKILFCNGAYDEAIRSLNKIEDKTKEVVAMNEAVAIYEGEFGDGGDAGVTIRTAFEGKLLTL